MIFQYNVEIEGVHNDNKNITAIYHRGRMVWQAVHSCFGAGFWINEKGWTNKDGWKNNK